MWYKNRGLIVKGTQENVVFLKTTRSEEPPVTDGRDGEDRLKVESQSIKEPKNLTAPASANLCSEVEGEEVTTEPIPDLVLNGVHEDDDECDRQKEQVKVPNEVGRSAAETPAVDSTSSLKEKDESTAVKAEEIAVESTPDTHLNSETLGEVESSSSTTSSSNNSTSVTPTVVVVLPEAKTSSSPPSTHLASEKTENLTCKQDQIGEETAKVVLGEEVQAAVETAPSNESSSNNDQVEETVNKVTNNNTFNQHNNNNNNTLNEANNNHSSPKVEMKSETNEVSTPNGVPINASVTVTSKLPSNGIIIKGGDINTSDGKDSAGDSIPASPTSIKSAASSNASSNGGSSTGGSLTNGTTGGYKRSSLTGIIDPNLEMSLNMSVSEMRQFLAQRKKQDPKKLPMDLKQKYEIISSM